MQKEEWEGGGGGGAGDRQCVQNESGPLAFPCLGRKERGGRGGGGGGSRRIQQGNVG